MARQADDVRRGELTKRLLARNLREKAMRIRLKAPFFFTGHLYQPGDVVDLPDGVRGPHRAVQLGPDRIDYDPSNGLDANHTPGQIVDEPLYDEVKEEGDV